MAQLSKLRAMLAVRELPQVAIADMLACSQSAARNYVAELLDAGEVERVPHGRVDGRTYKALYRLRGRGGRTLLRDPLVSALFGMR